MWRGGDGGRGSLHRAPSSSLLLPPPPSSSTASPFSSCSPLPSSVSSSTSWLLFSGAVSIHFGAEPGRVPLLRVSDVHVPLRERPGQARHRLRCTHRLGHRRQRRWRCVCATPRRRFFLASRANCLRRAPRRLRAARRTTHARQACVEVRLVKEAPTSPLRGGAPERCAPRSARRPSSARENPVFRAAPSLPLGGPPPPARACGLPLTHAHRAFTRGPPRARPWLPLLSATVPGG